MERNKLLVYFAVLLAGLILSFFATKRELSVKDIEILIFLLVFLPTLIKPDIGLAIIIISMLFSPEVVLGKISSRTVILRIEDIFLVVVVLASLIRIALTKDIGKFFKTRLTLLFFSYIGACVISIIIALTFNSQINVPKSIFITAKYFEYFLLFLIVRDNLTSLRQSKIFIGIFLITALFVSMHANIFVQQKKEAGSTFFRASSPFQTKEGGEPGTLGGYLIFMIAVTGGLLVFARSLGMRVFLVVLLALMFRGLVYTLSRGSYAALFPMLFFLSFFTRKKIILYFTIAFMVLSVLFMPKIVKERLKETVVQIGASFILETSPKERLDSWKLVITKRFPKSPIFGHGPGRYFIDSQLFTVIAETGLLGLILFSWILIRVFRMAKHSLSLAAEEDGYSRGLTAGFLAGFVGLLIHSLGANTFIIIRIMEPFWFLAAVVLMLPRLNRIPQTETLGSNNL
ncbi:MAG: O-antigen ligase family protein [Candidatus Omnitrophica bacterium]|nr:O-antigen ligase family protein [Candidatus Omnitrophota bacterium]